MSARSSYLRQFYLTFDGVIDVRKNLQSGKAYRNLHCNTFIESFIMSCNDKWCLDSHPFDFFSDISWILRNNTARLQCQSEIQPPEDNESNAVNIVWHIRTGDICLHCNDIEYFQSTWSLVSNAVGNNSGNVNLAFHSQSDVPWLKPFFPQATFSINSTLLYTVCSFFTSDIFITSGSALGSITAFAPPWFPVVFEEKRKNVTPARHLLTKHDAIQLDNGHPIHHSKDEIFSIVQTALRTKSSLQRVSRPRSKQQCEN